MPLETAERTFLTWLIHNSCNYRCAYCPVVHPDLIARNIYPGARKWIAAWDQIYERYGDCVVRIEGGEPFTYPDFMELASRLAERHFLDFSTNLHWDVAEFVRRAPRESARINPSFHPEFCPDAEAFARKCFLLRDHGLLGSISLVEYGPLMDAMNRSRELLESKGLPVILLPFIGRAEDMRRPGECEEEPPRGTREPQQVRVENEPVVFEDAQDLQELFQTIRRHKKPHFDVDNPLYGYPPRRASFTGRLAASAGEGPRNEELLDRLKAWIERGETQGPYSLQLNPTLACDLNCLFCRRQDELKEFYARNREIEHCRYLTLIREALELGARAVIVKGGGEPLLRRRLMLELAPLVKSFAAHGTLVTNGTHLDDAVARALVQSRWDQVNLSLDGPDAETHDFLRDRAGTFGRVMGNLDRLNEFKALSKAELPRVGFHLVLTKANVDRFARFIELARAKGAAHVEVDSLSIPFPSARPLALDSEAMRRFAGSAPGHIEALRRSGMTHNLDSFRDPEALRRDWDGSTFYQEPAAPKSAPKSAADLPCYFPFFQAAITPGGSIVPCCYAEGTYRSRTNLNAVSFKDAWRSGEPEEYRESMRTGRMMPFCRDCTAMYASSNLEIRGWLRKSNESKK